MFCITKILNLGFGVWGVGVVALLGIVVRNGILLVEFTDLLIAGGMPIREAVVEAARIRMTPVVLTATATILGMIPLAIGFNIDFIGLFTQGKPDIWLGGENVVFWGPLAWTIVFGLGYATFITLLVVPVMGYVGILGMSSPFYGLGYVSSDRWSTDNIVALLSSGCVNC